MTRKSCRNLTILFGSSLTVLAGAAISPALPQISAAFQGIPNAEMLVRLVLTMPALFIIIGAPFAGLLLDRWGRRPVLLLCLILFGLAGTSGFVLESLFAILVGRALLGLAVAGIMSGFTTLIADNFSGAEFNRFLGYQGAFMGLGGMVYILMGGMLAGTGWHNTFLIYLTAFAVVPGVLFAIDEPGITDNHDPAGPLPPTERERLPWRTITVIYLSALAGMLVFFVIPLELPYYLNAAIGADSSQIGLALSLQTPSAVLFSLLYQRLRARLSFQALFVIIFVTLGINHLIDAFTTNYWLIVAGLMIGGIGLGIIPPNLSSWVASAATPATMGRAIGGMTAFLFAGQFAAPFVTQPLIQIFGLSGTFAAVGLGSFLLALPYLVFALKTR